MVTQTLILGKRRYVVMPERDFLLLQKKAMEYEVRPELAQEAMQELRTYRKTKKAANWTDVKRRLGL